MREHRKDGAPVALEISLTPFPALPQSIPSLRRDRYRLREDWRFETGGSRLSPISLEPESQQRPRPEAPLAQARGLEGRLQRAPRDGSFWHWRGEGQRRRL